MTDQYLIPDIIMDDKSIVYDEYKCSACRKGIKTIVAKCKACKGGPKLFYHPGCVEKHKVLDRNKDLVKCKGPFEEFSVDDNRAEVTPANSRSRIGSVGSAGASTGKKDGGSVEIKIDWLIKTMREMKSEIECKSELKKIIQEIVQEEMEDIRQHLNELKKMIQGGSCVSYPEAKGSYSAAVKERKKEKIIIVKPVVEQESEVTKKAIKEKVDIKSMDMGISKLKKCSKGAVILGCETGQELVKLKTVVQEKMGDGFKITESLQAKLKVKIVNIDKEEMQLEDEELISVIKRQNGMNEEYETRQMKIVKRIIKERDHRQNRRSLEADSVIIEVERDQRQNRRSLEAGSVIIEVDEKTHEELISKNRISVGWKKCTVFNHVSVKRCFKCWGYYHIAKNCSKAETCHKCAGNHKATDCKADILKCVNCTFKNQAYNLRLNFEHDALDKDCPTYKRAIQEEKRRAGWED